ncbi:MAG TPA: phosphate signaling complex protein PhoU [Aquificae bacterium]|nr:phosphate signaling complex protein PhoU [Aquificota bacterium]
MSELAIEMVKDAVKALIERDKKLAKDIFNRDRLVDLKELEIEEQCVRILALYSPEAKDLRLVVAILKSIADVERMGDLAKDIAEIALYISKHKPVKPYVDLPRMMQVTESMVKDSVLSLIKGDEKLAESVLKRDDIIDDFYKSIHNEILELSKKDPSKIDLALQIVLAARALERIADHACNIAEYAIYYRTGKIVKHMKARKFWEQYEELKNDEVQNGENSKI